MDWYTNVSYSSGTLFKGQYFAESVENKKLDAPDKTTTGSECAPLAFSAQRLNDRGSLGQHINFAL